MKLGLEAKGALATATSAMAAFSDSMGYAEQGLSEHKVITEEQRHSRPAWSVPVLVLVLCVALGGEERCTKSIVRCFHDGPMLIS